MIRQWKKNGQLKQEVRDYFSRLYHEKSNCRPRLDVIKFRVLNKSSPLDPEREFTKDHIFKSLMLCTKDKALGLNGFSMSFLQEFWQIMKEGYF